MNPRLTAILLVAVVAAAFVWIASEVLEVTLGGRNALTLWLTVAMHVLLGIGVWGIHASHGADPKRLSAIATTATSLGFLVFAVPISMVALDSSVSMPDLVRDVPAFFLFGMLSGIGSSFIGILILVRRVFPLWTGIVILLFPWLMFAAHASPIPPIVNNAVATFLAVAWLMVALAGLRSVDTPAPRSATS